MIVVDHVECEYLFTFNAKVLFTFALIASRTLAHYDTIRDTLADVMPARRESMVLVASGFSLVCILVMAVNLPGVYAKAVEWGFVWELWHIFNVSMFAAVLYLLCSYIRWRNTDQVPVRPLHRWHGGWWSVFVMSYAANAYIPSAAGWYWSYIGQSSVRILCMACWLWPLAGAAVMGRPPRFLSMASRDRRSPESGTLDCLVRAVAKLRIPRPREWRTASVVSSWCYLLLRMVRKGIETGKAYDKRRKA